MPRNKPEKDEQYKLSPEQLLEALQGEPHQREIAIEQIKKAVHDGVEKYNKDRKKQVIL